MPVPFRYNPDEYRDLLPGTSTGPAVPDYLIRNQDGSYTFADGTTNKQVVDTLRDMGVLEEGDYNWFLDWFGESADQGQDVANQGWMVTGAGGLSSENQNWAPESRRRINLVYDWLNRYGEQGSFNPTTTFAETYGVSTQPIAQPGSGSQQGDLGPGYTPSGRPIFAGDAPTGGDPSAPYYTVDDVRADSEVVLGRKEPEEPPPPPETEEEYVPPPKDLTADTTSAVDTTPAVDTPPAVDVDTSVEKTQGIASTLGVEIPDFADFKSFMAKKRRKEGIEGVFEDEVEKEIERRATEIAAASGTSSSSSTSPYMGSSVYSTGFMGITPEMIEAALAAAKSQGLTTTAMADEMAVAQDEPLQLADGGIVSLMKDEGTGPTGEGIESFLMKYQAPGTVSRERKAAALRRTMQRLQQEQMQQQQMQQQQMMQQQMPPQGPPGMPPGPAPTAPGPMPTMQQGIMPMAG